MKPGRHTTAQKNELRRLIEKNGGLRITDGFNPHDSAKKISKHAIVSKVLVTHVVETHVCIYANGEEKT